MQRSLGNPIKVRKFWMDIVIPEGPPIEYERSGYVARISLGLHDNLIYE